MKITIPSLRDNLDEGSSWHEFLPGAWCVPDLLTRDECEQLIQVAVDNGIKSKSPTGDLRHRQRVKVITEVPELSNIVWERIRYRIPSEIIITEKDIRERRSEILAQGIVSPQECVGTWTPSRVRTSWNVWYCTGKGHLAAHRDAEGIIDEHERSFLTINGFLSDRPVGSGGATRFLKDEIVVSKGEENDDIFHIDEDKDLLYRVESDKAGKAVVFLHTRLDARWRATDRRLAAQVDLPNDGILLPRSFIGAGLVERRAGSPPLVEGG